CARRDSWNNGGSLDYW
nr:immunoglobulin heavy chain junction region [Macaca mulatta]MOX60290.1 immunoglobulin heavy chain junction region [Macaca mulatta]MOX60566.1 immunoglobulin heavy chain junction region [Macaca mulatta]MOX61034.1 immunoglobulin heavy chain junction region [Macaca mulatta]MOX61557.1 immunoglobulin heavy chain junction region [Macaca mulatta]